MIGKLKIAAVLAGALATAGFAAPASAHEHEGRFGWQGGYERRFDHERAGRWEHERREREWRRHEWREHAYNPYYDNYYYRGW